MKAACGDKTDGEEEMAGAIWLPKGGIKAAAIAAILRDDEEARSVALICAGALALCAIPRTKTKRSVVLSELKFLVTIDHERTNL